MTWIKTKDSVPDEDTRYAGKSCVKVLAAAPIKSGQPPYICTYVFLEKVFVERVFSARGFKTIPTKVRKWQPLPA